MNTQGNNSNMKIQLTETIRPDEVTVSLPMSDEHPNYPLLAVEEKVK